MVRLQESTNQRGNSPHLQNSPLFPTRSFTEPEEIQDSRQPRNSEQNLQAKLDHADRFSHHFSQIQVQANHSGFIQPQISVPQLTEQQDSQLTEEQPASLKIFSPPIQRQEEDFFPNPDLPVALQPVIQRSEIETVDQTIQPKLTIGSPGDRYEQEADAMAAQVVHLIHSPSFDKPVQKQSELEQISEIQPSLMCRRDGSTGTVNQQIEHRIEQARGNGHPLDQTVQTQMEQAFGNDFSGVKVHTDSQSNQLNQTLGARAFTTGQNIFFKQGEYDPGSWRGQELLAHELTHVVQQTGATQLKSLEQQPRTQTEKNIESITDPGFTKTIQPKCNQCEAEEKEETDNALIQTQLTSGHSGSGNVPHLQLGDGDQPTASSAETPHSSPLSSSSLSGGNILAEIPVIFVAEPSDSSGEVQQSTAMTPELSGSPLLGNPGQQTPGLGGYPFSATGFSGHVLASGDLSWLSRGDAASRVVSSEYWSPMIPRRGTVPLDRFVDQIPRDLGPRIETQAPTRWLNEFGFTQAELDRIPDLVRRLNQSGIDSLSPDELLMLRRAVDLHVGGTTPGSPLASYTRPNFSVVESIGERTYRVRVEMPRGSAIDISSPNAFNAFGQLDPDQFPNRVLNVDEAEFLAVANHEGRITSVERLGAGGSQPGFAMRHAGAIRWGGRILVVVGIGLSAHRIASATPEERPIVAAEETGGHLGGFAGTALATAGCVALGVATGGIGLFVCGLVGGVVGGVVGSTVAGDLAREAQSDDGSSDAPCPSCHSMQRDWEANRAFTGFNSEGFGSLTTGLGGLGSSGQSLSPGSLTPEEMELLRSWMRETSEH